MSGPAPRRPGLRVRLLRPAWTLHRWLGLLFALPLVVLSLTGALLVRYDWLERGFDRVIFRAEPLAAGEARPLAEVIRQAAARHPGWSPRYVELPGDPRRNVVLTLARGHDHRAVIVDAVTGEDLVVRAESAGVRRWMLHLHATLLLGRTGDWIVGLSSLGLLAAAGTGLWIYGRAWRDVLAGPPRWRRTLRDGHRHAGFLVSGLAAVLALTGLLLTLPGLLSPPAARPAPPASDFDWAALGRLEDALAAAVREAGGGAVDYLALPRTAGDALGVTVFHRARWWWEKFDEYEFDPATGALRAAHRGPEAPLPIKVNNVVGALHFGHQGGQFMRWLYLVGGAVPAWLAVSGAWLWWRRRARAAG